MTATLASLVWMLLSRIGVQVPVAIPPSPFDEVHALELSADDPSLIDGRGPTAVVELELGFAGTLHLWTRSRLDLFLRVEDMSDGSLVAEDDDSGGGKVPYLRLPAEAGARLAILIAPRDLESSAAIELHVVAAPETQATREAVRAAGAGLAEVESLRQRGELEQARGVVAELVRNLLSTLGSDHSEQTASALWRLAYAAQELSDPGSACMAMAATRAHRERTLPDEHPELIASRQNLAVALYTTGDYPGARALETSVLAVRERTLPEDHPDLLQSRQLLALTMEKLGDLPGARVLEESVLAARERTLPEDHPDLLAARTNLAATLRTMGDLAGARLLQESVVAAYERTLPEDHPDLLVARLNLAGTMYIMGELQGARALQESVLAGFERTLPEDHYALLAARGNLARMMLAMGDLPGARARFEAILAACERTLPEGRPGLLNARQNLAITMQNMGDFDDARALQERVVAAYERTLPEDHPELLGARESLAITLWKLGERPDALALQKASLAVRERTQPEGHPDLLNVRKNLAAMLEELDDLVGARQIFAAVLVQHEQTLPKDHPMLLSSRQNLALTLQEMGEVAGARALLGAQVAGMRARVLGSLALAPRQASETVAEETKRLAHALFLSSGAGPELQVPVFELQETMRMVAGEAARALRGTEDPEVRPMLEQARAVRAALGDLAANSSSRTPEELSAELTQLLEERDRLEREAGARLAARGVGIGAIEIGPLARSLGRDAALVTYRRIARWEQAGDEGPVLVGDDHLLAHVLGSDGALVRIDLGKATELEELVNAWRGAVGAPLLRAVKVEEGELAGALEQATAEALRARLLDPVLAVLGEGVKRLHVCADDLVFLVPLDALPWKEGCVGDRWSLLNEVSCTRLLSAAGRKELGSGLLALGGVDYDAGPERASSSGGEGGKRSSLPEQFTRLLQTRFEVETTATLAEELLAVEPVVLTRKDATKTALFEQAPGKRFLHLATHGWFAEESIKSMLEQQPGAPDSRIFLDLEQHVTGMAPMLLCGLALAGANRPIDSLGRRPGILTAEELCSLDLSACELAVLSACETNVGIRRAGQGIQSLQAALYAAGARSSITSLWKVDDAATRRLMEHFYTKLWEGRTPKARALWEAKRALREEGAPLRDWAGWVLTGDPE